jgi:uncharacterized protein (TIGR02145 family)
MQRGEPDIPFGVLKTDDIIIHSMQSFQSLSDFIVTAALVMILGSCGKDEELPDYHLIVFNSRLRYGSLSDIDGNTYKTIQIGTQEWMAENLRVSRYNDGTEIPEIKDADGWKALTGDGFSVYENDQNCFHLFGCLYNYFAAVNEKDLCPSGWHVPTVNDFTTLEIFLGGASIAGGKLKEKGASHWGETNRLSTNESGFTALPGGVRDHFGSYYSMGDRIIGGAGYWWTSTETDNLAWSYSLGCESNSVFKTPLAFKSNGFSIRCLRDK